MKKLLALVLALVMTMGLATVGTNAAFTDADSIEKKEAVDVMSAIGVLQGDETGAYNPAGILTREAAAKIIAYMILGKTAADSMSTASAPFSDVAADRWSAGAISYCASEGIIAGYDGKFFPATELNGYAFAKMCLVALGYDPDAEGLTGSTWSINTAKLALSAGLNSNLTGLVMSQPMTREQAAQMAFNTEKATMVEYAGGTNITTSDGTRVVSGAVRSNSAQGTFGQYATPIVANLQFCERYCGNLKLNAAGVDASGNPVNSWKYNATDIGKYAGKSSSFVYTGPQGSTAANSIAKLTKDLEGYTLAIPNTADYVNGTPGTDPAAITGAYTVTTPTQLNAYLAQGRSVELFVASDGFTINRLVAVDTYVAKVAAKDTINKTVSLTVYNGGVANTTKITSKNTDANAKFYEELYAMAKGDYVLLNASNIGAGTLAIIKVVGAPTAISGTWTGSSTVNGVQARTIGGTVYTEAATQKTTVLATLGNSYSALLDQYNNIILTDTVTNSKSYAYVEDMTKTGDPVNGQVYYAKLVFMDGTSEWAKLSKIASSDTAAKLDANYNTLYTAHTTATTGAFVSYTKADDGTYEISGAVATSTQTTTGTISKNATSYAGTGGPYTMTNNTTLLIYSAKNKTYTPYKGLGKLPSSTVVTNGYVLTTSGAVADAVVVLGLTPAAASDVVYVYDNAAETSYNSNAASNTVKTVDAIVNGEIKTLQVAYGQMGATTTVTQGMYIGNTYTDDFVSTAGTDSATALASGQAGLTAYNKSTYNAAHVYKRVAEDDGYAWLSAGVFRTADNAEAIDVVVTDDFICYQVDKSAATVTELSLPSENSGTTNFNKTTDNAVMYFILNADNYAAYAIMVID